jgi:SSS family solute:Na+ symporter
MSAQLAILLGYSALMIALGAYAGRRVKTTGGFFVAGRRLGPGLIFATMLAANIGAGSTIVAASLGYENGLAAWWWVGSAGFGSLFLAFWIGPKMRREAAARGLNTVGDYLEQRYSAGVRSTVALLLWIGTLAILAGQLIAMSTVLTPVMGIPKWGGCVLGGIVITLYFTAGGLASSAWVNVLQLSVKLVGFSIALPIALAHAGGWDSVTHRLQVDPAYWSLLRNGKSGWMYLALLGPAFIVSPALLQKLFGARDDRAVRIGVGANAIGLLVFAFVPPVLGIIARSLHPDLVDTQLALPTLLMRDTPIAVGSLGIAAVFSAEVSAADAILFMLATSLSQDLYRRMVNPSASDASVLRVARLAAIAGGVFGIGLALVAQTIIGTLSFFYSVLGVCLFVPVVAGLNIKRFGRVEAIAAIGGGMIVMLALQLSTAGAGARGITPAMAGLVSSIACALVASVVVRRRGLGQPSSTAVK